MPLKSIRLQNFRSYNDETFEFEKGVNIVVGPNASGKTNLLEALLVTYRGSSFRARDSELIKLGRPWARLDVKTPTQLRTVKITRVNSQLVKKQFIIDENHISRLSAARQLPTILFEPSHLIMLHGPPDMRRDYIDGLLSQLEAGYLKKTRDYKRVLAQRNALLKHGTDSASQLFAWDIRLSELGGQIAASRLGVMERINYKLQAVYSSLAGSKRTKLTLQYNSACRVSDYASSLLNLLETRQHTDIERGYTTVGPHRDDIALLFDSRPVAEVASRGETRTTILALKIIELGLLEDAFSQKPIVLLDDVFSELDGKRRRALTEVIKGYQTLITTTDADVVVQHFMEKCHIIPL